MSKDEIKRYLDLIPLFVLGIMAFVLAWTIASTNYALTWRNIVAMAVVPLNAFFFWRRHRAGVLFSGLILFLGLFGLLSYSPGLTSETITLGLNERSITMWGSPVFLVWIVLHFILSGRHYVGILTSKYWRDLLHRPNDVNSIISKFLEEEGIT